MKKIFIISFLVLLVLACKHEILLTVSSPSNLVYSPASYSVIKGTDGNSVTPTINSGGDSVTYAITSTGVTGITINKTNGVISWTNAVATGNYSITVTASNSAGSTTATYTLSVIITAPSNLLYSPASSTIVKATAGSSATPTVNDGGGTIVYALTGTIPSGISINASSGVISWTNAVAVGTYTINITATNSVANTGTTYTLTVNNTATVTAPTGLAYNPASASITQGTAGSSATPTINNGLGTITYSLTGTIPTGISINSSTGIISWTNAVAVGTYTLTISAANTAGKTTASYAVTVAAATSLVSFSKDILPVLSASCGNCHSYTKTYTGISGHTSGCNSIQNKISTSYCSGSRMPAGSAALSDAFIALFNNWIAQGKLNN